jgi:hypothetical protein
MLQNVISSQRIQIMNMRSLMVAIVVWTLLVGLSAEAAQQQTEEPRPSTTPTSARGQLFPSVSPHASTKQGENKSDESLRQRRLDQISQTEETRPSETPKKASHKEEPRPSETPRKRTASDTKIERRNMSPSQKPEPRLPSPKPKTKSEPDE